MNIAIIGSGIAGLLPAYYLSRLGNSVTVYEQESYPAMRTSYANGGQISVSNSEVWTSWSNIFKGVKWILKKDAPLLIRPNLDWEKALWLAKFLYHTASNDSAKRTAETIKLGIQSRYHYFKIIQEEGISFDQNHCGILHFYKNKDYFEHAKKLKDLYESNGCEWKILTHDEILNIEPTLKNSTGIIGGAWTPSDWVGDIHKFCVELQRILEQKYNVKFVFDKKINNFDELFEEKIVVANGVGSVNLVKTIGEKLPIYPVKGYSITIQSSDIKSFKSMPKVSLLDDQSKIVTSLLGTKLRVAGTAELAGENYDIRRDRIEPLLQWVKTNFPTINRKDYTQWACLRPMTPDMMPIVKKSKSRDNIYYHVGHGHLGWTLSPATAVILTKIIT
jgi:D-amino-acid dehydrogenase